MIGRIRVAAIALALLLPGCAYDPGWQGSHSADDYKKDLEACQVKSREQVRLKNAATPQSWILSPVTGPAMVRDAVRVCLKAKNYPNPPPPVAD